MSQATALLSLLAEGGNTGFWSYNPNTHRYFPDAASCTLLGCSAAPVYALADLLSGVHADDRAELQVDIQRAIATRAGLCRDFRVKAGGDSSWLCMRGRWSAATGAADGEFLCVVERSPRSEQLGQASERRFEHLRSALQGSPVVLYEQDAQLRYEWVLAPRVGLGPDAIIGRMASDFLEPASAQEIDSAKQGVMDSGKPLRRRFHIRPKGQAGGAFDVYMAPRLGPDGRVNGVISIAIDMAAASAQEQHLLAIFERAPVAITLSRMSNGAFLKANSSFLELMGYTLEEVLGSSTLELGMWHPPEGRDRMLAELRSSGQVRNLVAGYRKKSGQTGRLLIAVEPIELGGEQLMLGMMSDISALEETRQALSLSEARYKLLSEASFEGIGLSKDGIIVDVNEQMARILGLAREDMLGQPGMRNIQAADAPGALQTLASRGASCTEYAFERPDGSQVLLEVRSRDLLHAGDVLRISAARDVTEQRQQERALRHLQVRFERMMNSNMAGVYVARPSGEILEANGYFLNLIGRSQDDLAQGRLNWMDLTPAASMAASLRGRDELMRTGVCLPYEKEYWKPGGFTVHVLVALARLPGEDYQILAIVVDISALKAAQAQLQAMNLQLQDRTRAAEQAEASKTLFLSSVSHELRTPLHTMLGHLRLLRKKASGDELQQLKVVDRSSTQLLRLIEDLLEYNHSTISPDRLEPELVVLEGFLASLQLIGVAATADTDNQFFIELGDGLPASMVVDERRLTQVLRILIDNACKYTQSGLIVLTLALQPRSHAAAPWRLRFSVEDNGRGMDAADVDRIFEPLQRGSNADDRQGLGLGLAIAAQWVERMGSRIVVESMRGVGSHFSFELELEVSFEGVPSLHDLLQSPPQSPPLAPSRLRLEPLPHKDLSDLGELIHMGRLGRLRDWARDLELRYPQQREAALLVTELASNADMDALVALHGRWAALGSQEESKKKQREN